MQRVFLKKRAQSSLSLKGLTVLVMHLLLISPVATTSADEFLPDRWTVPVVEASSSARSGRQLAKDLDSLSIEDRERQIETEIRAGNVPDHWKKFVPIKLKGNIESKEQSLIIFVSPDYLSLGSDQDFLRIPLSPHVAQNVADHLECLLPTRHMVDQIYAAAEIVLKPQPMAPTDEMIRVSYFARHNQAIQDQLIERYPNRSRGQLLAGHKKDVVLTPRLAESSSRVAIYGWHEAKDRPIQPLYVGHAETWVDYSHGIRLVARKGFLNGMPCDLRDVLADEKLCELLSNEGPLEVASYNQPSQPEQTSSVDGETTTFLQWTPDVRICINESTASAEMPPETTELLFYALPNGNTIEQTLGKQLQAGDDWHYDIQHIAAQSRFLRREQPGKDLILILLEAKRLSWPAWRMKNGDEQIPKLISELRARYSSREPTVVLSGHSGGGSLIFGFLNASAEIPSEVTRIAFLDATYGYETERHNSKIANWLKRPESSFCVLAYKDDEVTLNGKRIVSATGGTWYRSRLMRDDLAASFQFSEKSENDIVRVTSADRRIQFLLHMNPANKILHTVQVEKNGLIQCLLSGTPLEERGYQYYGERASELIR
ncbi:MAG: hypothetical protein U0936_00815 [Planctomycetaceae bacterium]